MNRVLITGIGVTSPVGSGRDVFWENLTAGRSGVGPITLFDASTLPVRIAGEVKNLDCRRLGEKFPDAIDQRDRKVWLGLDAADQAVSDADLVLCPGKTDGWGRLLATCVLAATRLDKQAVPPNNLGGTEY